MSCFGFHGIDKIKLALNPLFLNKNLVKMKKNLDPKNRLTLHRSGEFYSLCIHAEYFENPQNIYLDIWRALTDLFLKGYFQFPGSEWFYHFYFPFLQYYVLFIQQIEFYYDFPRTCVYFGPQDELVVNFNDYKGTLYSTDYSKNKRKSIVCIYDRNAKRKHNNNEHSQKIDDSQHDIRLEFRLTRANCEYLHFENIEGSFDQIHEKYAPYLGIVFSNYVGHSVYFDDGLSEDSATNKEITNPGFNQIKKHIHNRTRYTGELKKSEKYIRVNVNELDKKLIIQEMKNRKTKEEADIQKIA